MAYTSEEVLHLELFQLQEQEGPCLDCIHTGQAVSAVDLAEATDRWPRFAPRAMQDGIRAVHALPMRLRAETIGALNLFTTQPGPLAPQDLRITHALADVATIGILHERTLRSCENLTTQLQAALDARIVIEQAKGLLAERSGLDFSEVFDLLRAHARNKRMRLSDVARGVVEGSMTVDLPLRKRGPETRES
jgi:GAF domain-containing protein